MPVVKSLVFQRVPSPIKLEFQMAEKQAGRGFYMSFFVDPLGLLFFGVFSTSSQRTLTLPSH